MAVACAGRGCGEAWVGQGGGRLRSRRAVAGNNQ